MKMEENGSIISFRKADILNGENTVIYGMNLDVRKGEFVYIVGKVGTGKTSIVRTMIAENPPGGGSAEICGYDLSSIRPREVPLLRRKIGVVFQDFQLLMDRNVHDNLEFALKATGWKDKKAIQQRIQEALVSVGMESKAHKMPHQMSGGEQQRIAIARALLNSPEVIIADEPTGNLDNETAEEIMSLLSEINRVRQTAIVMVTHNTSICERYTGKVMLCGHEKCVEI